MVAFILDVCIYIFLYILCMSVQNTISDFYIKNIMNIKIIPMEKRKIKINPGLAQRNKTLDEGCTHGLF